MIFLAWGQSIRSRWTGWSRCFQYLTIRASFFISKLKEGIFWDQNESTTSAVYRRSRESSKKDFTVLMSKWAKLSQLENKVSGSRKDFETKDRFAPNKKNTSQRSNFHSTKQKPKRRRTSRRRKAGPQERATLLENLCGYRNPLFCGVAT